MSGLRHAFLVLVLLLPAGCATLGRPDDPWFGRDKAKHFVAGVLMGAGGTAVALNNGADDSGAVLVGVGFAMAVGAGKEWVDRDVRKTFWSWKDLAWDLAGAAAGAFAAAAAD